MAGGKGTQKIREVELRLDHGDSRFRKLEKDLRESKAELDDNSKTTNENNDLLTKVYEGLFVDTADKMSIQSAHILLNQKVTTLWSVVIFLIISIAGISFTIIQKNMEPPANPRSGEIMPIYYSPHRENKDNGVIKTIKGLK